MSLLDCQEREEARLQTSCDLSSHHTPTDAQRILANFESAADGLPSRPATEEQTMCEDDASGVADHHLPGALPWLPSNMTLRNCASSHAVSNCAMKLRQELEFAHSETVQTRAGLRTDPLACTTLLPSQVGDRWEWPWHPSAFDTVPQTPQSLVQSWLE